MKKKIPNNINIAINEFIKEVNDLLGNRVDKIILYGSYARGDFGDNSDVDIMILTDLSDKEIVKYRDKISDIAYEIEYKNKFDFMLSPLVKNINKFNYWLEALPFYMNVQREGVILSESQNI